MWEKVDSQNLSREIIETVLNAKTFNKAKAILQKYLPDSYRNMNPNQLPNEINYHLLGLLKKEFKDDWDPPGDPNDVFRKK